MEIGINPENVEETLEILLGESKSRKCRQTDDGVLRHSPNSQARLIVLENKDPSSS